MLTEIYLLLLFKASRCKLVTWQTGRNFVWICLWSLSLVWSAGKHIGSPLDASWSRGKEKKLRKLSFLNSLYSALLVRICISILKS